MNKKCQIQILDLANSDLNEKGRQDFACRPVVFCEFLATNPYSPETNNPPNEETTGELL